MARNPSIEHYLAPLLRITNTLYLTPRYNFEKRKINQSRAQKFIIGLIVCFQLGIFIYNLNGKSQSFYGFLQSTAVVMDFLYSASLLMINLLSITEMNFWKKDKLGEVFKQFCKIDDVLSACNISYQQEPTLHSTLICYTIYFACYVAYDAFVWTTLIGISHYRYYITLNIQRLYLRGLVVLMYSVITAIDHRYKCINAILRGRSKGRVLETKKVLDAYNRTTEVVDIFNRLFGWQLLILNILLMTELLFPMNTIITLRITGFKDVRKNIPILLQCLLWMFSALFIASKLAAASWAVTKQADKVSSASYNLLQELAEEPSGSQEAREDLAVLAQAASSKAVTFSAAGFFNVDYTMLFTLVTTFLTYLIVLLQFNK